MVWLIAGLVLFLGIHSIAIVAPAWRDRMAARLGENPWRLIYSVVSIAGLALVVWGYIQARQAPIYLYSPPLLLKYLAAILLLPVFPMMLASKLPGRIRTTLKHPLLVAVKTWALAHLLAVGSLAGVVLSGSFLLWAVVDRISIKRRKPEVESAAKPPFGRNDWLAVLGGLAIYAAIVFWFHPGCLTCVLFGW